MCKQIFPEPTHTQTPNHFFDRVMREIDSLSELKVTLAIIRQTRGWHKDSDRLSLTRIIELTGLARASANAGIKRAVKRGYIERIPEKNSYLYRLKPPQNSSTSEPIYKTVQFLNRSELETKKVQNLNRNSSTSEPKTVQDLNPQKKERNQQKDIKETSPRQSPKGKQANSEGLTVKEFIGHLLAFRQAELNVKVLPTAGQEASAAKFLFTADYSLAQVKECYHFLKQQKWRGTGVTLVTVKGQIADFLKGNLDHGSHRNGDGTNVR